MNRYEYKQEMRRQRLEARADRLAQQSSAAIESGMGRLRAIPFGQPILVGHHSERRDRNYRRKAIAAVNRGVALQDAAKETAAKAAFVGTGGYLRMTRTRSPSLRPSSPLASAGRRS